MRWPDFAIVSAFRTRHMLLFSSPPSNRCDDYRLELQFPVEDSLTRSVIPRLVEALEPNHS